MNILIYDDNENDISNLNNLINSFCTKYDIDFKVDKCPSNDYLYNNIYKYDLIFLDIEIGAINGIEVGLELKKIYNNIKIIITSVYKKYLIDGYKINAERYLIKPISKSMFESELGEILLSYILYNKNFLDLNTNKKIYYREIVYFESINRYVYIYLNNGKIIKNSNTLEYWGMQLKDLQFFQIYRSIIINLNYISGYNSEDVILNNNVKLPISRRNRKEFINKYMNYIQGE